MCQELNRLKYLIPGVFNKNNKIEKKIKKFILPYLLKKWAFLSMRLKDSFFLSQL